MHYTKLTLALWATSGLLTVYAAEPAQLSPITVSGSPIHEHTAFEVPSQIDSLSGAQKTALESGSLGEMLDHIPGVNHLSTGAQSGKPVIRGLTGNRVKILSNGQSTDFQGYDTRHNPNIEPFLAERIEVVRGPQSVLYGSEAMGGVVNVIQAPIPYGQDVQGEVASEYNTNNQEKMFGVKMGAGSAASSATQFGVQAGLVTRHADNFNVPNVRQALGVTPSDATRNTPLLTGEVPNTNFENNAANLGAGLQGDWGLFEVRHTQWRAKQNFVGTEEGAADEPYEVIAAGQKLHNDETQLKAELELGGDWLLKPSWTHTRNQREESHDLGYETMNEDKGTEHYLDILVKRDDVKLALQHPKIGDFEGEVGVEATEKAQFLRSGHLSPNAKVSKRAIYVFEEADYDRWLVQFGARYDWHDVNAPAQDNEHFVESGVFDASNDQRQFEVMTGSLGATYRLTPNWSVAGNVARGFRAPSIFELYAGGEHGGVQAYQLGNPDLKAETALNTDLSLRWQTLKTQMVATVYQNWIDNYIYLANTGNYRYTEAAIGDDETLEGVVETNSGEGLVPEMQSQQTNAQIHGVELSVNHRFNQAWSTDAALEVIAGRDTKNSQNLPLMPANNLRLGAHYQPQDWSGLRLQKISVGVKMVDAQNSAGDFEAFSQFDDLPFGRASTDAYALWNVGYQAQVKLERQTVQLGVRVENLFDTDYVDFLSTYKGYTLNQGRNVQLSARMSF